MKALWISFNCLFLFFFLLIGCAPSPIVLHPSFGYSVNWARQDQVFSPTSSENLNPMTGLHGTSASKAMVQYEKAFDQKQKAASKIGILVNPSGN